MQNRNLDKLFDAFEDYSNVDKIGDININLYKIFFFSSDFYSENIYEFSICRRKFLENQSDYFFDCIGISKEKRNLFISHEGTLITSMLKLIHLITPYEIEDAQKSDIRNSFLNSITYLRTTLERYNDILANNYRNHYPCTVNNFISYVDKFAEWLSDECNDWGASPYYKVIKEWVQEIQKEYTPERLHIQLELIKQGPHLLHKDSLASLTFPELFKSETGYKKVMEIFVANGKVAASTGIYIDDKGGRIKELIAILKWLKTTRLYREDIDIDSEIILAVIKNSFKVNTTINTINKVKFSAVNIKFFIDELTS